jgi:hypothetical protein
VGLWLPYLALTFPKEKAVYLESSFLGRSGGEPLEAEAQRWLEPAAPEILALNPEKT